MGALWKIERARETHTCATESVDHINFECAHTYTHIDSFMYARCMITIALHSDGQGSWLSAHANVLRGREWNLKTWNARMWRKRPEDGRRQEEMEIEIADPALSPSLCIARSASWISREKFSRKTHLCLSNKRGKNFKLDKNTSPLSQRRKSFFRKIRYSIRVL